MKLDREKLLQIIQDADTQIKFNKLTDDVRFDDIGADSLDIMNIFLGIQEHLEVEIDDALIEELSSVRAVLKHFNG